MSNQRQIILDTETTGLDPKQGHRIIEIGCIELINRRRTENHFQCYLNPERTIEKGAVEVHGLTQEFLADKPLFPDIADKLIEYLKAAEIIIHNAPFDVGFLNHELNLANKKLGNKKYESVTTYCDVIDTLVMARRKHPGQQNSLDALCRRYKVDNSNRELHGALLDSELLAQVYLMMTGGQTQLFQTNQDAQSSMETNNQVRRLSTDRQPLPVIKANTEEMQTHQEFLNKMKESGECAWKE